MPNDGMQDRDLLIRLDEKLDGLFATITELKHELTQKAGTERVSFLESRVEDLESRVNILDKMVYMALGGIAILQCALSFFKH